MRLSLASKSGASAFTDSFSMDAIAVGSFAVIGARPLPLSSTKVIGGEAALLRCRLYRLGSFLTLAFKPTNAKLTANRCGGERAAARCSRMIFYKYSM